MSDVVVSAVNYMMRPVRDFTGFAEHVENLLDRCASSDIVVFPELFTFELLTAEDDWRDLPPEEFTRVATYTEEYRAFFGDQARRRGQFIVAGSHLEEEPDGFFNVASLFGPDGEVFRHRKTHLFAPEREWHTLEGDTMEVYELPFATVGFNICYEMQIPECATSLARGGAEIILGPTYAFSEDSLWRLRHCARARTIENQVYFVHAATGWAGDGHIAAGWAKSSILSPLDVPGDPRGVLVEARDNVEEVITSTLDLARLRELRERGGARTFHDRQRRSDVYRTWAGVR